MLLPLKKGVKKGRVLGLLLLPFQMGKEKEWDNGHGDCCSCLENNSSNTLGFIALYYQQRMLRSHRHSGVTTASHTRQLPTFSMITPK